MTVLCSSGADFDILRFNLSFRGSLMENVYRIFKGVWSYCPQISKLFSWAF
jgi:hypothetical protein